MAVRSAGSGRSASKDLSNEFVGPDRAHSSRSRALERERRVQHLGRVPADAHLVPECSDHALAIRQHRAAAEEFDRPAPDPQAPQPSEGLGGGPVRIGKHRVGESQALGPGAIVLDRVGIDRGDLDPGALELGMAFAKLAKFPQSPGCPVEYVEEQDQRPMRDELAQPVVRAARVGEREIGQRLAEQTVGRRGGGHARENSRTAGALRTWCRENEASRT